MKISIIIVNWQGKLDTVECLSSLQKMYKFDHQVDVVVVDNDSKDNSKIYIRKAHPWVKLVYTKENLGFSGGNNYGINIAMEQKPDYIWLLNNDTIVEKNSLSLVKAFNDPHVGIAGSKIYFYAGREFHRSRYQKKDQGRVIWYAGGLIDWNNMYAQHRGVDKVDQGKFDNPGQTDFVTGCSMMIKRKVIETVGLLDEKFYLYFEDLDYCLRAKSAGYKILYQPSSLVWHKNAGSTSKPGNQLHDYYLLRNRLLIGARYASWRTKIALLRESVNFLLFGTNIKKRAILDALMGNFGNRYLWQKQIH